MPWMYHPDLEPAFVPAPTVVNDVETGEPSYLVETRIEGPNGEVYVEVSDEDGARLLATWNATHLVSTWQ